MDFAGCWLKAPMARQWLEAEDLEAAGHAVPALEAHWRSFLASLREGMGGQGAFAARSEELLEQQRVRLKECEERDWERINIEKERLRAAERELELLERRLEMQEGLVQEAQMAKTILELLGPEERWEETLWTGGHGQSTLEEFGLEPLVTATRGASSLMRATEEDLESETKSEHAWLHQILDQEARSSNPMPQTQ